MELTKTGFNKMFYVVLATMFNAGTLIGMFTNHELRGIYFSLLMGINAIMVYQLGGK